MKPRVTMIISRFSPSFGGTERQALLLSKELLRRGWPVDVLTQRYDATLPAEEMIEGVPVHRLRPSGGSLASSGLFLLNGLRYLKNNSPAILHAHMLSTPAVMACLARRQNGGRAIVKLACSGSYGEVAVGHASWLGRRKLAEVFSTADQLICVTDDIRREVRAEGVPEHRLAPIPNGVDTREFSPLHSAEEKKTLRAELGLSDGVWILFAGRLTRQKRPDLVLDSFLKTAAKRADLFLLIVGDGDDLSGLKTRAEKAGLSARIRWAGQQSRMASYYKASDIFILPSEGEGMSNSLLEAMSCGLACIVSRTAMAQEMLGDREAMLVPPGDGEAITQAFNELANNAERRTTLGNAARSRAVSRYSIERVTDRYEQLYASLTSTAEEAA